MCPRRSFIPAGVGCVRSVYLFVCATTYVSEWFLCHALRWLCTEYFFVLLRNNYVSEWFSCYALLGLLEFSV